MIKKIEDGVSLVSEKGNRIINLQDLMDLHGIDKDLREVIRQTANVWEVAMNKKDWSTELVQLHQIKADFKPVSELIKPDLKDILLKVFKDNIPVRSQPKAKDGPLLANINLADLHIGRVEQKKPDQYEAEIYNRTMDIVNCLLKLKPDKFLLTSLGDMANSEMNNFTTSWKNFQHNWMDWKEMFKRVLNLHNKLIRDISSQIATDVIIIPGNHDRHLMFNVWTALDLAYSLTDNVNIDNQEKPRKYYKRWDTQLAFSHWDWEKAKDRLGILSQEQGLAKNNHWVIWHFHDREVKQFGPLEVETIASPAVQSEREKNQFAHKVAKLSGKVYDKKKWKIKEIYW